MYILRHLVFYVILIFITALHKQCHGRKIPVDQKLSQRLLLRGDPEESYTEKNPEMEQLPDGVTDQFEEPKQAEPVYEKKGETNDGRRPWCTTDRPLPKMDGSNDIDQESESQATGAGVTEENGTGDLDLPNSEGSDEGDSRTTTQRNFDYSQEPESTKSLYKAPQTLKYLADVYVDDY